ncbi:MAG: hypothetical protein JNL51_15710 [Chitinophagaceae bacterium]|nr:hypothetical protein [Chitinophagaceae bacterium]
MIKRMIGAILLCVCFQSLTAQNLMHSFGATIAITTGKISNGYSRSNFSLSQNYLSYFPRYNFVENENSSISIGAPIGLGVGIAQNSYMGEDIGFAFAYDLPLVIDYNIGCKSTYDNEQTFGGYLGAGFGYNYVSISGSQYSDFKGSSYGPIFRGGVRIGSNKESWAGHSITIGVFYKKDLQKNPFNSFGFNVYYDL